jgi:hypothetical protein
MKTQLLPNWCKKIGIALYVLGALPSAYVGFSEGMNRGLDNSTSELLINFEQLWYFDLLLYLGMLIYFLSKEKVEDNFIRKLRLETYQVLVLVGIGVSFISLLFENELKIRVSMFLESFLVLYLLIFWYKKRQY